MMTVLTMTIAHTEEVLVAILRALNARNKDIAVLVHLVRVGRNVPYSGSKSILCNNIFLDVALTVKDFKVIFIVF